MTQLARRHNLWWWSNLGKKPLQLRSIGLRLQLRAVAVTAPALQRVPTDKLH